MTEDDVSLFSHQVSHFTCSQPGVLEESAADTFTLWILEDVPGLFPGVFKGVLKML